MYSGQFSWLSPYRCKGGTLAQGWHGIVLAAGPDPFGTVRSKGRFKQQSHHYSWLWLFSNIKKSTVIHFGQILISKTELSIVQKTPKGLSSLVTWETPFRFQYPTLVASPMSLAWNYACYQIVWRNKGKQIIDQVEMTFRPASMPISTICKPVNYQITGIVPSQGHCYMLELVSDIGTGMVSPV